MEICRLFQLHQKSNEEPIMDLLIYPYSENIINLANWERFSKDCIKPAMIDRGGATAEESIQENKIT